VKILIVDDELLVRRSLKRVCVGRGHEVQEAEDGQKGLELWRSWNPDLVFLDVLMPKLTGIEVLRMVTANRTSKVVMMSAYTGSSDQEHARSAGADLFLAKPFPDIFSVIQQAEELFHDDRCK
jgi:CheY-like chemotaxis protein